MKVVYSCCVAIFLCVFSGHNGLLARSFSPDSISIFSIQESKGKKAINSFFKKRLLTKKSTKEAPKKSKKRNRKGVKPLWFAISNGYTHQITISRTDEIQFKHHYYYSYSFSGNRKRGPPTI